MQRVAVSGHPSLRREPTVKLFGHHLLIEVMRWLACFSFAHVENVDRDHSRLEGSKQLVTGGG